MVIDLDQVESCKPELAAELISTSPRRPTAASDDKASLGIVLCRGHNRVIVDCALRDTNKPTGVEECRLARTLRASLSAEELVSINIASNRSECRARLARLGG